MTRRLEIFSYMAVPIRPLQRPHTLTKLRLFLGLCNEFRRFVFSFARITELLNQEFQKDQAKKFGLLNEESITAIGALWHTSRMGAIKRASRLNRKTSWLPVLFMNQATASLTYHSKRNSSNLLFGTVTATVPRRYPDHHMDGSRLTLLVIGLFAKATKTLPQLRHCLSEFDFLVVRRAGIKNQDADALSRPPTKEADNTPPEDELAMLMV